MDVILQTARKSRKNAQQEFVFENDGKVVMCIIKTRKRCIILTCNFCLQFFDPKIDQTDKYFVRGSKVYTILMISLTRSTCTK